MNTRRGEFTAPNLKDDVKTISRRDDAKKFIQGVQAYLEADHHLRPKCEHRLGTDRWCSKADIFVEFKDVKLFVEVEGSQPHPDTNVTKYWYWIDQTKPKGKVVLIHVFGHEFYDNNYRSRTALCDFLAEKIRRQGVDFVYCPIPVDKHHPWSERWLISDLLDSTKKEINKLIQQETIKK